MDQALILPTHNPQKPWVTRTPLPTATPWLIPTATFEPQIPAIRGPTGSGAMQAPTKAAGHGLTSGPSDAAALAMPSLATKTVLPGNTPGPTLTLPPTTEAATALPSGNDPPTETADAFADTAGETPLPPPPRISPGDQAQFETYVRDHYSTITGQPLDIVAVTLDTTDANVPRFVVEVAGGDTNNVFAAQPAASVSDFGHRLLDDAKFYFNGQDCAITVVSTYQTSYPDVCKNNSSWCDLVIYDESSGRWTAAWTYVLGTSIDAADTVETWNAGT